MRSMNNSKALPGSLSGHPPTHPPHGPCVLLPTHGYWKMGGSLWTTRTKRKGLASSSEIEFKEGKNKEATRTRLLLSPAAPVEMTRATQGGISWKALVSLRHNRSLTQWTVFNSPCCHAHKLLNYIYLYWDIKVRCNLPNRTNCWKSAQWKGH